LCGKNTISKVQRCLQKSPSPNQNPQSQLAPRLVVHLDHPLEKDVVPFIVGLPLGSLDGLKQWGHHVGLEQDQQLSSVGQLAANLPTDDGEETLGRVELHLLVAQLSANLTSLVYSCKIHCPAYIFTQKWLRNVCPNL